LGWPQVTEDLKLYHPTDVLETGYDLIFFWVARMILMSKFLVGEIPFKTVYMHGLVRNDKGEKISKSLGGNVDPLEITAQWGTDATRMALVVGVGPGSDSKLSNEKLLAYKKFANKLWNISRYVAGRFTIHDLRFTNENKFENELTKKLNELVKDVTLDMDNYRFYLAAEKIYHFTWHEFADKYIEESKGKSDPETLFTLNFTLFTLLKLLHPFMPFVTEEIWGIMHPSEHAQGKLLMIEAWPII
jgi:valyl-tRNA synthetase